MNRLPFPHPNWMLSDPKPWIEARTLNGVRMEGFRGKVRLQDIGYWIDNRRTDMQIALLKKSRKLGVNEVPSDDDLYDFFEQDPELDIERLARDILLNELRNPIVISYDNTLLDGNRRYLAHRWIAKNGKPYQRDRFDKLDVWVLTEEFSDDKSKLRVITQYNLLDDFRKPWTDFIKAKLLWEEHYLNNLSYNDLFDIYGGPGFSKAKIIEFIKTYEVVLMYADNCPDQEEVLAEIAENSNFIWFQQLQRSYREDIRNDDEFQKAVFDNIRNGYIEKTDDLKNLNKMRGYKEAWAQFKNGEVEKAHVLRKSLDLENKKQPGPEALMDEINGRLERLLAQEGLVEKISAVAHHRFHELAEQVPGQVSDVNARIAYIVRKLQAINSVELASLSQKSLSDLEAAISRVIQQARATQY